MQEGREGALDRVADKRRLGSFIRRIRRPSICSRERTDHVLPTLLPKALGKPSQVRQLTAGDADLIGLNEIKQSADDFRRRIADLLGQKRNGDDGG